MLASCRRRIRPDWGDPGGHPATEPVNCWLLSRRRESMSRHLDAILLRVPSSASALCNITRRSKAGVAFGTVTGYLII